MLDRAFAVLLAPLAASFAVETAPPQVPPATGRQNISAAAVSAADWTSQGHRSYYEGELEKSIRFYQRALKAPASDAAAREAWLNGGVIWEELGQPRKAADWFNKAALAGPADPRVLTALGWACFHSGDFTAAESRFRSALDINPGETQAALGLGRSELKLHRPAEAAARLAAAAKLSPHLSLAHYWEAEALEADQDVSGAIDAYRKAALNDSSFVEARYALGRLYMRHDHFNEAAAQFSRVIDADPRSKRLQRLRQKIRGFVTRRIIDRRTSRPAKQNYQLLMPQRGDIPTLRVGIGTSALGRPLPRYALEFECTTPFAVQDAKTGKKLIDGDAREKWGVHFLSKKPARFEILNADYRRVAASRNPILIRPQQARGGTTIVYDLPLAHPRPWSAASNKNLRGDIELSVHPNRHAFKLVNIVDLESYTHGVLSAEMPIASPLEALKAQSVVARSHALFIKTFLHRHKKDGYDLCDDQHCQVYAGVAAESERSRIVVDATRARILAYRGKVAQVLYSSNCGGHTQSGNEVKGWGDVFYWKGVPDMPPEARPYPRSPWELKWWLRDTPPAYCMPSSYVYPAHYRWTRIVPASAMEEKLDRNERIGKLRGIRALKRSVSGHVNSLLIMGTRKKMKISHELNIRNLLGIASQRSALFTLETEYGADGRPETFIFYGGGWGHGVGMCQSGAMGRADRGLLYADILKAYYRSTELGNLKY